MAKKKRRYAARLEKSALVLSHDPELPAVCMKCGSHDGVTREPKMFRWRPAWSRYLVVCGIGLFIMMLTTVRASLEIPLCPRCYARWSTARTVQIGAVVAIVVALAVFTVIGPADLATKRIGLAVFLATIVVYVVLNLTFVRRRMLRPSAIDEKQIGLLGVHATAIDEIIASAAPVNERPPQPPPTSAS
jgi:hypothetical protein